MWVTTQNSEISQTSSKDSQNLIFLFLVLNGVINMQVICSCINLKNKLRLFIVLVFLEHDQLDSYISEMLNQSDDDMGLKTFFCGICNISSNKKQIIERHVEAQHVDTRPFECHICGKLHKNRRSLQGHYRIYHKTD